MIKKILLAMLLFAPMAMMAQKVAHFDYPKVMQSLAEFQTAQTALEELGQRYSNELKTLQDEITRKYETYRQQADSLPENMRARKEQELNDMGQRYQQAQQDNEAAFQKARAEKMQPLVEKIVNAVNAIAKEDGYTYVIDLSSAQPSGIFINTSVSTDITDKVMNRVGGTAANAAAAAAKANAAANAANSATNP